MEIWKEIKGYNGRYKISNLGRVYSNFGSGKILKNILGNRGYFKVSLKMNGERTNAHIHRLVAKEFVSGHFNGAIVNHIDGDKLNNHYTNLEWVTQQRNNEHSLAEYYIVVFPCNTQKVVYNLTKFCKKHNLHQSSMSRVANGERNHHKGFKCKKLHIT